MTNPVSIENLTLRYGNTTALSNVSLQVAEGDYLGIIGPNGGGKTSLLKVILGLVEPTFGEVLVFGNPPGATKKMIGYVPQITLLDKKFPITVEQVVMMGCLSPKPTILHRYKELDRLRVHGLLDQVNILKLKDRMISDLSGGEFQKMLIARALAVSPRLMLLDEPTASVDASSRDQIFSLLKELNKDMTIIMVTHDLLAVSSYVKSLACIGGELIAHGVPHHVLKEHDKDKEEA